ncbi:hypothetical protein ILUMI_10911 [Ignelater luminosus]|uniref:Transposable element P transposase-like RNase H domain-containing protein n=1 Tax=Ignelater luminosus TaxID=2038154 RepID=A0A8K0D1H2_IGNLU|nr:hypothetical protein ILUMI_10911 [Ignelater luminosus]
MTRRISHCAVANYNTKYDDKISFSRFPKADINSISQEVAGPSCSKTQLLPLEVSVLEGVFKVYYLQKQTLQACSANTTRKNKLRRRILKLARKNKVLLSKASPLKTEVTAEGFKELCVKLLPENAVAKFVKARVDLKNKPPTGRRSLQRRTQNVNFKPGCNDFVFAALKLKLSSMSEKEKCCTICIDEMSLKSALFYDVSREEIIEFHNKGDRNKFLPAQSVIVIMVRGIHKNFKQSLCYFFTKTMCKGEQFKSITLNCTEKIQIESGDNVRAVVSDPESNFRELVKSLGISAEKPCQASDSNTADDAEEWPTLKLPERHAEFAELLNQRRNKALTIYSLTANYIHPYPFIKQRSGAADVTCEKCRTEFNVGHGGASDIEKHLKSEKHRFSDQAAASSSSMLSIFKRTDLSTSKDLDIAAAEEKSPQPKQKKARFLRISAVGKAIDKLDAIAEQNANRDNEFDHFCRSLAVQLKNMPRPCRDMPGKTAKKSTPSPYTAYSNNSEPSVSAPIQEERYEEGSYDILSEAFSVIHNM